MPLFPKTIQPENIQRPKWEKSFPEQEVVAGLRSDDFLLPVPDDNFDLGTSRFGVMFFRDPRKALGELRRVLRPGARACFLAWGRFDQPYWSSTMGVVQPVSASMP